MGNLSAEYITEFHTGILDDLAQFEPGWVDAIQGSGLDVPRSTPVGALIAELNFEDSRDRSLMAEANPWLREFVYKSFNRDAATAAALGSAFNVTPLFAPLIEHHGVEADLPGTTALAVTVPNVRVLPWEAIVEFREHPGSREARAKLREFDQRAAEGDPQAAYACLLAVSQEITTTLFRVIKEQRRRLPEQMGEEALLNAVSLVPVVGPAVAVTSSLAQAVLEDRRFQRSWVAALMSLHDPIPG
jgi:hypothetical protein